MAKINELIKKLEVYARNNYASDRNLIKLILETKSELVFEGIMSDWISVEDELPKNRERVLVTYRLGVTIALYDAENNGWLAERKLYRLESVTAWKKLPSPYKKEIE